jgi:hypothetical protein
MVIGGLHLGSGVLQARNPKHRPVRPRAQGDFSAVKKIAPTSSYQSRTLPEWAALRVTRFMPRITALRGATAFGDVRTPISAKALQVDAAHKKTPAPEFNPGRGFDRRE